MLSVLKSKLNTLINVETIRNALCPEIYLQLFVCVVSFKANTLEWSRKMVCSAVANFQ